MFIDIWDTENQKTVKINKFNKALNSSDDKQYNKALHRINIDFGIQLYSNCAVNLHFYKIEFKNSEEHGFNQYLYFTTLIDCYLFLDSDTFAYLFESEDIDYIKITAGKSTIFKYDNRG
jgi:hypothetical protein